MGDPSTSTVQQHQRALQNAFDGIAPQASPSFSGLMKKGPCDVFINHRGRDVKHKLASIIYHTLELVGLRAFLDVEELELGNSMPDEIEEAMRAAAVHIAIFSENYAQSPWCLAELSFMLKTGTTILPIFYNVKPDDLRWVAQGKGLYAPAFSHHKKKRRYCSSKLEEWERALHCVSYLSGYMLNENDDEGRLLKSIVNSVLGMMKKVPLEVAKHPVAMDEVVEDFERTVGRSIQSVEHVQIVGIVGFGGSGKTTLATELYNRKRFYINRSSFLYDVRDAAYKNALHIKQKKLLEDFRIQNVQSFDNVKEGKGIVADQLKTLRVLIVLDDVDHEDQLDALLPPKESLGSGSVVIVTTREGDVLTKWGITSIYKIQPLQHFHAKQMFCWHAFLQPSPLEGFEDLTENFLNVCGGLPLSLKVIGGQLYGRTSTEYWYAQLDKIRKTLPKDIKVILKVSFDALEQDEQDVFLDVACFFIGEERSLGIAVWDGSGWNGLCSLETLLNKCLVEVDKGGRIRMHDHLRDLGREIAITRSPSRFWFHRKSMQIQRGILIRGIMAATDSSEYSKIPDRPLLLKEWMKTIRNPNLRLQLQLLVVRGNEFNQKFEQLSRSLLWLRWFEFEGIYLPSWLLLENIRVLELIEPLNLQTLWEDTHPPLELRKLLIRDAPFFREFPRSIGHLKHLKKLSLVNKSELSSLPKEFCLLHLLEHLDLEKCAMLSNLPSRFGELVNLRHINLNSCMSLEKLPVSFKQLIKLEFLNLYGCETLTLESSVLENITNLKYLNCGGCSNLHVLPHHITNQGSLRELCFWDVDSLREVPASIGQLSKLETLNIGSPLWTRLPASLGNLSYLVTLILQGCVNLESLPVEVRQLSNLQTLFICRCSVRELAFESGLGSSFSLQKLREIHVSETSVARISLSQNCCPSLQTLCVEFCTSLTEIETLPTALKFIELNGCTMLETMGLPEAFEKLTNLETLEVRGGSIRELPFGRGSSYSLCNLRRLYLEDTHLPKVSISQECCPSLQELVINLEESLMEIEILPTALQSISLTLCKALKNISGLHAVVSVEKLIIICCTELIEMPSLAGLVSLNELVVRGCSKINKIEGLEKLTSLEELHIETNWKAPRIDSLGQSERLREVNLVAENMSAFEHCIQSIQIEEWPYNMMICGRTSMKNVPPDLLPSSNFSGLAIVKSLEIFSREDHQAHVTELWSLTCEETHSCNAATVCFLIDCKETDDLWMQSANATLTPITRLRQGEWAVIGVYTEASPLIKEAMEGLSLRVSLDTSKSVHVVSGTLVVGEKARVLEAFNQFFQYLKN
ncbi:hypothetical protein SUGI_0688500 [Cryptomeria japonica]|uniref:disease resistance protein TAO1 n=1 Tax=Cryptomeria japonica TaxID=3369 RepID=UPI002414709D|nr:disease resistance protein TAO1 [Cryptomeria japonica]GLJ34257.1 hypothetical protein SUGI_0688500 [Cryptomeria japonica]